jgi:hypothetical protein
MCGAGLLAGKNAPGVGLNKDMENNTGVIWAQQEYNLFVVVIMSKYNECVVTKRRGMLVKLDGM